MGRNMAIDDLTARLNLFERDKVFIEGVGEYSHPIRNKVQIEVSFDDDRRGDNLSLGLDQLLPRC